jgi:hypothetical protein
MYLVDAWADESIVPEVATDIGGDDFTIDAIPRHEVLVLSVGGGRRGLSRPSLSRRHLVRRGGGGGVSTGVGRRRRRGGKRGTGEGKSEKKGKRYVRRGRNRKDVNEKKLLRGWSSRTGTIVKQDAGAGGW